MVCSLVDSVGGAADIVCESLGPSVLSAGTWSRNPPRAGKAGALGGVRRLSLPEPFLQP